MKNLTKKIIATNLSMLMLLGATACGGGGTTSMVDPNVEDTKTLKIVAVERGYGVEMIKEWAKAFEKTKTDVKVSVEIVVEQSQLSTYFELGPGYSDYDIFFNPYSTAASLDNAYKDKFDGFKGHGLMDYTEFYNEKVYGEDITLKEKLNPSLLAMMQNVENNGHYYAYPWAMALQSIVVNHTVVTEALGANYKLPNTTEELVAFSESIKNAGYTPFTYPGQIDYWTPCFFTWWAQYEGLENYNMFYEGKVYDEIQDQYIYSADIYKQQGRLESLLVMEELLDLDNGYHLASVNDYNALNFTTLQTAFLNSYAAPSKDRKYAMFPNGDWLASESANAKSDEIVMMSMPIVSTIIKQCPTIENDAELSKLVDAIDAGSTALEGNGYSVSQADFDRIAEARSIVYGQANSHIMYSPVYANAKTLIKDFLLYIASDEACEIYLKHVKPGILPVQHDYPETDDLFFNSVSKLSSKVMINQYTTSLLSVTQGVTPRSYNSGYYEALLGIKKTSKQYHTAQEIFENEFVSEAAFKQILRNAGLI